MVAAANDRHTLQAVFAASRDGVIRPILVGERTGLNDLARELGHPLSPEQIVDGDGPEDCASKAVALIRPGLGRMLVKGMLPTRTMLRAVVDHETGIRTGELMSHVAVLDVPSYPKLIFDTDGGMNVAPSLAEKGHILDNALQLCRFLGYDCPQGGGAVRSWRPSPQHAGDPGRRRVKGRGPDRALRLLPGRGPHLPGPGFRSPGRHRERLSQPGGRGRRHPALPLHRRGQRAG